MNTVKSFFIISPPIPLLVTTVFSQNYSIKTMQYLCMEYQIFMVPKVLVEFFRIIDEYFMRYFLLSPE